ncbi:MAG: Protein of unknown function (DUF1553)/Planctomycete cytochrome C [Verrucomicrobia bacterium]|nr:MAG: Protein of unknown function (DUF1553)/Planctomycete cytochrome C [Verrucomicrobiota bacterium]
MKHLSLPLAGLLLSALTAAAALDTAQTDFFEKRIRPVLIESCYKCHSADSENIRGGLLVDTRDGLLQGGDSGPAVVPGDLKKSALIAAIRHEGKDPDSAMPPKKSKLPEAVIADFEEWVKMGAPDPRTAPSTAKHASKTAPWDAEKAATHWAFQKVSNPPVPKTADPKHFAQNPIDQFVLAKLAENKLAHSPKADKLTLIRRLSYDLTGLPPNPEEVDAFLADNTPNAYEKLVDRLLASSRYGERWGRHWLDIARYADTSGDRKVGKQRDPLYSYAWTYRDYVINAFNQDLPYDQFLLEQIAADRLPEAKQDKTRMAALGFLTVGKRFMGVENDVLDDRIDVVTKGLMGITGSCARCHDHKFDPIPTRDYYGLHGIFASSEEPLIGPDLADPKANPAYSAYLAEVDKVEKETKDYEFSEASRIITGMLDRTGDYLLAIREASKTTDTSKKGGNFRLAAKNLGLKAEIAAALQEQVRQVEASKKMKTDPLLGPWFDFSALPADHFAELAPALAYEMAASTAYNPALVSTIIDMAPSSMKDVAAAYTKAFGELNKALGLPEFVGRNAAKGGFQLAKTQKPLANPPLESLRRDIFAVNSSLRPTERTVALTFGVQFTNSMAIIRGKIAVLNLTHTGAPVRAMPLIDKLNPRDSAVLIRGEPNNRGPVVPRHFLTLLGGSEQAPFKGGSGRLELARSIASKDNPLTARVIVNRIWQWHFGQAIVRTVSDFGTRSEPPTHPELLDWMATWLMEHDWSLKQLNKLIVMSATYQQESRPTDSGIAVDPTNQWLWRSNVQRLDFEQIRDTLLHAGASLDDSSVGGKPFQIGGTSTIAVSAKNRYAGIDAGALATNPNRRTVYAMIDRAAIPEMFNTFDFANPDISTGERILTTVPQQALFMMNSPFVAEQVRNLFERRDFPKSSTDDEKVAFIYRTAFQRPPSARELEQARTFLNADPKTQQETNGTLPQGVGSAAVGLKKSPPAQANKPLTPWERYAQVVFLTNELMYIK